MFFKLLSVSSLVFGLALQAQGHAIISPALGVSGTPTRNDVQRPSNNSPCGNVDIASALTSATPITVNADGTFTATITNFNAGQDGSRQVTAKVDATGTGKNFVAAQVTKNGDLAPTDVGSQQLTVQLPAGTKCTGPSGGTGCIVSFTTAGGFGNCVAVQQKAAASTNNNAGTAAAAAAAGGAAAAGAAAGSKAASSTTTGNANGQKKGHKHHHHKAQQQARDVDVRAVGTRAARSYRELEESM